MWDCDLGGTCHLVRGPPERGKVRCFFTSHWSSRLWLNKLACSGVEFQATLKGVS